jgi:hypothetical protein
VRNQCWPSSAQAASSSGSNSTHGTDRANSKDGKYRGIEPQISGKSADLMHIHPTDAARLQILR